MNPTLEKVAKKVSRACNTCRLKRKKCDGLDPCAFCVDNKLECLYSKEPRRRGPPSGYLRYTETRVAILEILLGLYISKLPNEDGEDPFLETAKTLQSEAKICTQDVWDAHKARWTRDCPSSKIVEQLVVSFAPYTPRSNQEAPVKALLPTVNTVTSGWPISHRHSTTRSAAVQDEEEVNEKSQLSASQVVTQILRPSSSETADDHDQLKDIAMSTQPEAAPMSGITLVEQQGQGWQENVPTYVTGSETSSSIAQLAYPQSYQQDAIQLPGVGLEDGLGLALGLEDSQSYTGSYWRTVDLALPETENHLPISINQRNLIPSASTNQFDLPPIHILSRLLDVYYQHVHPSYPILPCRTSVDAVIMSPSGRSDIWSTLMLSVCAYSGRLSVSANPASISPGVGGLAGMIAADLWYEQARTSLSVLLKKESSLELVQATLLLALRDYGKGSESQAWVLVGLAVRMGQDLQLHEVPNNSVLQSTTQDPQLRRNIWGVCLILDLLLSLQMGKPPATFDSLKTSLNTIPRPCPLDIDLDPSPPFAYAVSLCRIISMINFHLYLGYPLPVAQSPPEKLLRLRTELDMWHHSLPVQYRISIGHQPRREVLEINMLYHVAIIILYRPIFKEQLSREVVDIFLEAASSFSVLLEKYWQSQITTTLSNPGPSPPLSYTSPNMIYFVYTAATAHLSGYKIRQTQQRNGISSSTSSTSALQTQLHLLKCLEALSLIGHTWELARRCWKALDTLMENEHLKPRPGESSDENNNSLMLGKRKREMEAQQKRTWQSQGGMIGGLATRGSAGSSPLYLPSSSPQAPAQNSTTYIYPNANSPLSDPTVVMTPSPNSTPQFMSGFPQPPSITNIGVSGWEDPMLVSTTTNGDLAMFDPLLSAKWMSDTSQALSAEWNNPWSEDDLQQSCVNGMVLF